MSQTQMTSPIAKDETIQQTNSLLTQIKNVLTAPIPDYISDAYDNTATYAVGEYCIHENTLYRCTTAISSPEEWTAAHWTATTMAAENTEINTNLTDLTLDTLTLTNQTTSGQGLILTNIDFDGRWIGAEVAGGRYASFRPSGSNKLVIKLVDDNGTAVSSATVTVKLYHLGKLS